VVVVEVRGGGGLHSSTVCGGLRNAPFYTHASTQLWFRYVPLQAAGCPVSRAGGRRQLIITVPKHASHNCFFKSPAKSVSLEDYKMVNYDEQYSGGRTLGAASVSLLSHYIPLNDSGHFFWGRSLVAL